MKFEKMIPVLAAGVLLTVLPGCVVGHEPEARKNAPNPFQAVVQQAGEKVFPALVYIRAVRDELSGGRDSAVAVSGSGVVISADGEVVTNHHVIDKASDIRVLLNDGRAFEAKLVGSDKDTDIALLKLKLPPETPPLAFAEFADSPAHEGEFVMALGAPWGLNRSVSIGIISCANRYLPDHGEYSLWYQTDAAISPGNSGGPLIDTDGRIVGINTLGMMTGGAVGFTIPAATIKVVLPRLRRYGKANWAWFGLHFQPLRDFDRNIFQPYSHGVVVAATDVGSPARRAGFESNDLLVAIDGVPVTVTTGEALPALRRTLGLVPFGRKVTFTVERAGKTLELRAAAAEKGTVEGDELSLNGWGFTAKAINRFDNPNLYFYRNRGVFVYGVKEYGGAARGGLHKQDIIVSVNGRMIDTLADLSEAYGNAEKNSAETRRSVMVVMRSGATVRLTINYSAQ